ncbi:MAG: FkbM family methyltransferase [Gammaproteobacteria bacterium]|nr:MAG: FkbM family methyltransferase [Gammaproteobacteria bacterium]
MALAKRITGWLMRKLRTQSHNTELSLGELMNIEYDRQLAEVMQRRLRPESICIDGGAHKGQMLLEMCRLAPKAVHHAFEPIPELAKQLQVRFPGSQIHQHAIADYSGSSSFKYVRNAPAYSGLKERTYDHDNPEIEDINVEVVRLDDVISDSESIEFIKLDLEGGEYHAMKGAVNLIRRCKPIIVFEAGEPSSAYYGVTSEMIFNFVSETLGYSISTMKMWLENESPFNKETFIKNYHLDFYYIAYGI